MHLFRKGVGIVMIKEDILKIIYQEMYAVEVCYGEEYLLAIERIAERIIEEMDNVHNEQDS